MRGMVITEKTFKRKKPVVVAVSGGFDPVHVGHIRMFREAKALGDYLVVILNNDNWLKRKKGKNFMPETERKELIESIRYVDEVVLTKHTEDFEDGSVCEELRVIKPDVFCNGGDRTRENIPEIAVCAELGTGMVFGVGGGKVQSSSWLLKIRHRIMIASLITFIQETVKQYGAWGIGLASFIEEIVVPIPSTLVIMFSGFIFLGGEPFSAGAFKILILTIVVPTAIGLTLGSLFVYFLAYFFGKPAVDRYGRWVGLSWGDIEKIQVRFNRGIGDELVFFGLRSFPIVPSVVINAFCGLTRLLFGKYLTITFLGVIVRASILSVLGWQAGGLYFKYAAAIDRVEKIVLTVIAFAIVSFILYRRGKSPRPAAYSSDDGSQFKDSP